MEDKNFIFLDEVSFSVASRTKRGRSVIGTSVIVQSPSVKSKNFSVIAAASKYGMFDSCVNQSPVNDVNLRDYLIRLKDKCTEIKKTNPYLFLTTQESITIKV
ncbi:hypothetical protein CDIK_2399 [Cucumispora dikerogammari]|nr:hypothetical protein CDIK_2399 [Cucumispora dikerogammari]